jgi:hypothetical protein
MKNLIFVGLFFLGKGFLGFSQDNSIHPAWLQQVIDGGKIKNFDITDIKSFDYKGQTVYLVNYNVPCCDRYSASLFALDGHLMGFPFGGISGKGDMKFTDFRAERINETLVYESELGKKLKKDKDN